MKKIASRENSLFRMLLDLSDSSKQRKRSGKTLLDGIHLLQSCIDSGIEPELIVVKESSLQHPEISSLIANGEAVLMADSLFDRISPVKTPTGILSLIGIPVAESGKNPQFCILLDRIQDPGNLGSILRSAAAAGADAAYLSPGCADPWSPRVLRGGMGAHFMIGIHCDFRLEEFVSGFSGKTVAMALEESSSLYELDLSGQIAFLIGNEGAGISDELLSLATFRAKIPMPGKMESLNAASAAAICLFERTRQQP
ncbi:MAG: RNA methyltransferase [Burkholderiales bacterium]|nr:RNA methyltransferase [Burkholderiales bacterium]